MGREIRRVPAEWEHPTDDNGRYRPVFDESFEAALKDWKDNGDPPDEKPDDRQYYRPDWTDEQRTHYQGYETVSEGTPKSPVFATLAELAAWMQQPIDRSLPYNQGRDWQSLQGRSREQAEAFCKDQWVCSMVGTSDGRLIDGVTALTED